MTTMEYEGSTYIGKPYTNGAGGSCEDCAFCGEEACAEVDCTEMEGLPYSLVWIKREEGEK